MENIGYRSYHAANLESQIANASPIQLVLVLTDGLLDEIARARAHIVARRIEAKGASIGRCIELLNGLASSLDMTAGSEVVTNLAALYDYCVRRLNVAGIELNVEPLDEAAHLIGVLREGWQGAQDGGL
ncbi:flagellar export chaperone FliS [Burkholderia thailandensis]|uniref:Flagellar secretion chaperone FliS n=2 Tax=pseudomallei group TaxID=111527 RepID=A0AAW9CNQ3_BURTH|nr:flagellar export chaperone FliS [Burkholderia thailandensis]AHI66390.1 flagellar protein FliS [Burkholderia thailandensis H0587]AOJ52838.1 flagellar protein FliS [Burkholderia thailandensis]AVR29056.1 flagellar export chaperone FliS [Burkholderia thailandensis]MCS3394437.1 flagellar export chaperone FliS [Burkholderia thailandensis]MCS6427531.1 flagellar export chaperone FliS [Burkholderia thailandensis]